MEWGYHIGIADGQFYCCVQISIEYSGLSQCRRGNSAPALSQDISYDVLPRSHYLQSRPTMSSVHNIMTPTMQSTPSHQLIPVAFSSTLGAQSNIHTLAYAYALRIVILQP